MSVSKEFVTAGNATFTVECPANSPKPHYTFKVRLKEADGKYPEAYFVSMLTGSDNESDYSYVGKLDTFTGQVALTKASKLTPESYAFRLLNRILARIWGDDHAAYQQHGYKTHHEGKCCRCGRRLTVPSSIESGWGPECIKIAAQEAA